MSAKERNRNGHITTLPHYTLPHYRIFSFSNVPIVPLCSTKYHSLQMQQFNTTITHTATQPFYDAAIQEKPQARTFQKTKPKPHPCYK